MATYLVPERATGGVAHLWDGNDTACAMVSSGKLSPIGHVVIEDKALKHRVCRLCLTASKASGPTEHSEDAERKRHDAMVRAWPWRQAGAIRGQARYLDEEGYAIVLARSCRLPDGTTGAHCSTASVGQDIRVQRGRRYLIATVTEAVTGTDGTPMVLRGDMVVRYRMRHRATPSDIRGNRAIGPFRIADGSTVGENAPRTKSAPRAGNRRKRAPETPRPPSEKQLDYLKDLVARLGWTQDQAIQRCIQAGEQAPVGTAERTVKDGMAHEGALSLISCIHLIDWIKREVWEQWVKTSQPTETGTNAGNVINLDEHRKS